MKRILVATDGSINAKKSLVQAKTLAEFMSSKVTIINVASNLPAYVQGSHIDIMNKSVIKHQKEILEEALKVFQGFSGEVNTLCGRGEEAEEIIKEAEKGDYDLIVMGSRGKGLFSRAILGSTSNKVLNQVSKDVLIIK